MQYALVWKTFMAAQASGNKRSFFNLAQSALERVSFKQLLFLSIRIHGYTIQLELSLLVRFRYSKDPFFIYNTE